MYCKSSKRGNLCEKKNIFEVGIIPPTLHYSSMIYGPLLYYIPFFMGRKKKLRKNEPNGKIKILKKAYKEGRELYFLLYKIISIRETMFTFKRNPFILTTFFTENS